MAGVLLVLGVVVLMISWNGWGGRGYDDLVPGEVTKTTPSGERTT